MSRISISPQIRFKKFFTEGKKEDCWNWNGSITRDGYGRFWSGEKVMKAHKLSYLFYRGDIRNGLYVLHNCDNSICVNPEHLYLGTQKDNIADMDRRGRRVISRGENAGLSKLTWAQVKHIRKNYTKSSIKELSNMFKVHQSTIRKILNNKTWVI